MSASSGPFGPGFFGHARGREQPAVFATHQGLVKCQERRGPEGDGDLSDASWTEEERPESAEEPVGQRQAGCPPTTTTKHDELLLEQEILRDHRSHATATTQLRGHDGEVEQDEQEVLHARVSVGQTPRATQRCPIRESAREFAIRDAQVFLGLEGNRWDLFRTSSPTGFAMLSLRELPQVSGTTPIQNCWLLFRSTSSLRTNSSLPSAPMR